MEVHCLCSAHPSPLLLRYTRTTLRNLTRDGQGCGGYDTKSDTQLVYTEPMRLEAPFRESTGSESWGSRAEASLGPLIVKSLPFPFDNNSGQNSWRCR